MIMSSQSYKIIILFLKNMTFFMDGIQLSVSRLQRQYEGTVYFLPFSPQQFLVYNYLADLRGIKD